MSQLTHLDEAGCAHMVDVGAKEVTARVAVARGRIRMAADTLALIREGDLKKGDVLTVAQIAGIQAAKRTHELIPLCHPLLLNQIALDFTFDEEASAIEIEATVREAPGAPAWLDARALDGGLDGHATEVVGGQTGKVALEAAHGGAGSADDDNGIVGAHG